MRSDYFSIKCSELVRLPWSSSSGRRFWLCSDLMSEGCPFCPALGASRTLHQVSWKLCFKFQAGRRNGMVLKPCILLKPPLLLLPKSSLSSTELTRPDTLYMHRKPMASCSAAQGRGSGCWRLLAQALYTAAVFLGTRILSEAFALWQLPARAYLWRAPAVLAIKPPRSTEAAGSGNSTVRVSAPCVARVHA